MVRVAWRGVPQGGSVTAHRVNITASGPGKHQTSVAGTVESVAETGELAVLQENGQHVRVDIEPDTILVHRDHHGHLRMIKRSEIAPSQSIWVLGGAHVAGRLRATVGVRTR